jgi:hypothetical protein
MREFGDVDAVKILLDQELNAQQKVRIYPVHDPWHVAIIRNGQQLCNYAQAVIIKAINNYHQQRQIEQNTDGRVVNMHHPVRLSGGVQDAIELLETVEPILDDFEESFEILNENAGFRSGDIYENVSKNALNFQEKIIPRVRLHIHTYLWILWTHESLNQAIQFHGLMETRHEFEELTHASFPYISHPPLIVATIACSAMLEEVGATWLNAYVDKIDYKMDNTSAGSVMSDIEMHYSQSHEFDVEGIEEWVVDTRNDISHYVTRRGGTVSLDEFEEFAVAVQEGINLVDSLLSELVVPPIEEFRSDLSCFTEYSQ